MIATANSGIAMERKEGLEPSASSMATRCSTRLSYFRVGARAVESPWSKVKRKPVGFDLRPSTRRRRLWWVLQELNLQVP